MRPSKIARTRAYFGVVRPSLATWGSLVGGGCFVSSDLCAKFSPWSVMHRRAGIIPSGLNMDVVKSRSLRKGTSPARVANLEELPVFRAEEGGVTIAGLALAGAHTIQARTLQLKRVCCGTTVHAQFEFTCLMLPGTYFFGCGVRGTIDADEIVLHRVVDAVMCRVIPEPELIATALFDMAVTPRIRLL